MCRTVDLAGNILSTASRGTEREFFINNILSNVIAPPFRIGSGDVTDAAGNKSGQADIVIEYGNSISFPMISPRAPRLYLAEGVCAIIEVKSDVSAQWRDVLRSHKEIATLSREYGSGFHIGYLPRYVPHYVVGYRGWKDLDTVKRKQQESGLDGILILDSELFHGAAGNQGGRTEFFGIGAWALFAFLMRIQALTSGMVGMSTDYSVYANGPKKMHDM